MDNPPVRQPSFASMSAQQRAASLDARVRQIEALTADVIALESGNLDGVVSALIPLLQVDGAFRGIEPLYRLRDASLWQRLRWLVTGK